jgi:uncharacterized protein (TIGR02452 family)
MSLKSLAAEVLAILEAGGYEVEGNFVDLGEIQKLAVTDTKLYRPKQLAELTKHPEGVPEIFVSSSTTQEAAFVWAKENSSKLAILNFASARNPGGGFLNGAKAQEEDLCRCSGLYPCLLQCKEYYEANRQESSLLYTDYAIFSPEVPFFRTSSYSGLLGEPYLVSVITAPAPNSGPYLENKPDGLKEVEATFFRRWKNVLRIAKDQCVERLILGAWGCGAFGGDPVIASRTAKRAIESEAGGINQIQFAIPATGKQSLANFTAFKETFELEG